jgi:hypothetical protein
MGLEPITPGLQDRNSTIELRWLSVTLFLKGSCTFCAPWKQRTYDYPWSLSIQETGRVSMFWTITTSVGH